MNIAKRQACKPSLDQGLAADAGWFRDEKPKRRVRKTRRAPNATLKDSGIFQRFLKPLSAFTAVALCVLGLYGCQPVPEQEKPDTEAQVEIDTYEKRLSYLAAYDFHKQITGNQLPLDMEIFQAGLAEAFSGKQSRVSPEQAQQDMKRFQEELKSAPSNYELRRINVQEQVEFLNSNKFVDGTVTQSSGLQYRVVREGEGKKPTKSDSVKVRYRGSFIDGTVFDETDPGGEPQLLEVGQLIKGWQEALTQMPEGSVWEIALPPALGYGYEGNAAIPGNVVLLFRIELEEVVEAEPLDDQSAEDAGSA